MFRRLLRSVSRLVPLYAIDPATGQQYSQRDWRYKVSDETKTRLKRDNRTYTQHVDRSTLNKRNGPLPEPPPASWLGSLQQWNELRPSRRAVLRFNANKRVYVDFTTECPVNKVALNEYLSWGCDSTPVMTKRLLGWDGVTRYFRNFSLGRLLGRPALTMTSVNRSARGVAAEGTGLRDLDQINSQPTIAANLGVLHGMTDTQLEPLHAYITRREHHLLLVSSLTGCTEDDAKNLFITCVYGGDEWGWLWRHPEIECYAVKCALSELVKPFRKCVRKIRKLAIAATPKYVIKRVGTDDPNMLWYIALTRPEDRALAVMRRALADRGSRVRQLIFDGLLWQPPANRMSVWSERDDRALERYVNSELAKLAGMRRYPLKVKIKAIKTPPIWNLVKGLRSDNAALRERVASLERELAIAEARANPKRMRKLPSQR